MMIRLLLVILFSVFSLNIAEATPYSEFQKVPIQHKGRIKPFDAYARSTVKLVTSKSKWNRQSPTETLLGILANRDKLYDLEWIRIDYLEMKELLELPTNHHYFSANAINLHRAKISSLVQSSQRKRNQDLRPTKMEQKAELLLTKLFTLEKIYSGESIAVIPSAEGGFWQSPEMAQTALLPDFNSIIQLYDQKSYPEHQSLTEQWIEQVYQMAPYLNPTQINLEVFYYQFHPFQKAWVLYLIAFLLLTFFSTQKPAKIGGAILSLLAMASHTLGLVLRTYILERPPVSNMYESMVFMNWVLMLCAIIFWLIRKNYLLLSIGSLVSALVMIYASILPIDSSLDVLVPVLRSNYWLTIHVLTIVSSYGAFGLAMGLGHRHLFQTVRGKFSKQAQEESAQLIYRVMQVGILLIGIGTILGGVWANASWGRFWGWDPKETWALITFLGYIVIVHLRFAKLIGPFGIALGSILGFLLVLMTWYGVNFVLGRGLHSYGFGSGGMGWIIYYLIVEGLFVAWVFSRYFLSKKS